MKTIVLSTNDEIGANTVKLPTPLKLEIPNEKLHLQFKDTKELDEFTKRELNFWNMLGEKVPGPSVFKQVLNEIVSAYNRLNSQIAQIGAESDNMTSEQLEQHRLQATNAAESVLNEISAGRIPTIRSNIHSKISYIAEKDPEAAVAAWMLLSPNPSTNIGNLDWRRAMRPLLLAATFASEQNSNIEVQENSLHELESKFSMLLQEAADKQGAATEQLANAVKNIKESREEQISDWRSFLKHTSQQFADTMEVYDQKLALEAPAAYWDKQRKLHSKSAIGFSVVFILCVTISLYEFFNRALPHIASTPVTNGTDLVSRLVPVILTGFIGVWVLRILGRQLGNHLQLMQDASERQVMMKTFLALSNTDKLDLSNDERLLMLQALFRQSAVSAQDDSPPLHWAELLERLKR